MTTDQKPPAKPPREFWIKPAEFTDEEDLIFHEYGSGPDGLVHVIEKSYADRLEQRVAELTEAIVFSLRGLQMWRTYQSPGNIAEVEQRLRQALKREGGSE